MKKLWGILVAAGSGQRMQIHKPKQYVKLLNQTVIEHSISKLKPLPITALIVVIAKHDSDWWSLNISAPFDIQTTLGGSERFYSVLNGLKKISGLAKDDDLVLVHDAARPCVDTQDINKLIKAVDSHNIGGILAIPANDTLKRVSDQGQILKTIDRSELWQAQTPQIFRYGILKHALEEAHNNDRTVTDEASAIEYLGKHPVAVQGSPLNIKITTQNDLLLAQAILNHQRN